MTGMTGLTAIPTQIPICILTELPVILVMLVIKTKIKTYK